MSKQYKVVRDLLRDGVVYKSYEITTKPLTRREAQDVILHTAKRSFYVDRIEEYCNV